MRANLFATALSLVAVGTAQAWSGTLSGTDTVDTKEFSAYAGDVINYTVTASGSGSNTLTFKLQQKRDGLGWKTLAEHKLDMPSDSASGTVTVDDLFDEVSNEILRVRVSRKIGTKKIEYTVSLSY